LNGGDAEADGFEERLKLIFETTKNLEGIFVGIIELSCGCFCGLAEVSSRCGIGISDCSTSAVFGVAEHEMATLIGLTHDGGVGDALFTFDFGVFDECAGAGVSVGNYLVALFENLRSFADICWDAKAHLIDDVEDAFAIDDEVTAGQTACLHDNFLEAIDQLENVHERARPAGNYSMPSF
jgi:hypothetical protein